MKTLAICSAKGGSNKTSTAAALAVEAVRNGLNVALIDLNSDQGSLTQWWLMRGSPLNPRLIEGITNIPAAMKSISKGFDVCIIDTPPLDVDTIEQAVAVANAVLIPVRPSALDATTVASVVFLAKKHRKDWAFLLSSADGRDAGLRRLVSETAAALAKVAGEMGGRLFGSRIGYRAAYIKAMGEGRTGPEISRDADIANEVSGAWTECKALLGLGGV